MPESGIAVLSPHIDDAVLSCWSVLTSGLPVTVINVFAGVPETNTLQWWDRLTGATSSRERMAERIREDEAVLGHVRCSRVNLNFLDDQYRQREQDVKPVLLAIFEAMAGARSVYAPAGIGGHPDHLTTRAVVLPLLQRGFSVTLYGELPYCHEFGWPHWVTGEKPDPHLDIAFHWQRHLSTAEVSLRAEESVVEELSIEDQQRKLELLRGYRTQFPALDSSSGNAFSRGDALAYELFWPLEAVELGRWQAFGQDLLWNLGFRHGSPLKRLSRRLRGRRLGRSKPR